MFAEMLSYNGTTGFAEVEICTVTGTGLGERVRVFAV
jgi:hypothetical protein